MTRHLLLGIYLPIMLGAAAACWLLLSRLVMPAWRKGDIQPTRMAIGLGALCAMAAHLAESALYGLGRWVPGLAWLLTEWHLSLVAKLLIIASVVFTLAGLSRAETNAAHLRDIVAAALVLWAVGVATAVVLL